LLGASDVKSYEEGVAAVKSKAADTFMATARLLPGFDDASTCVS
jgi:hypothetical protein